MFYMKLVAVVAAVFFAAGASMAASPFSNSDFVRVSGIQIQKSELTQAQWGALNASLRAQHQNPWEDRDCYGKNFIGIHIGGNFPASCISADDAQAYIDRLNEVDSQFTYRLPTQAELKRLVDATVDSTTEARLRNLAWISENSRDSAQAVCRKGKHQGLCDILGNLWELTSTRFGNDSSAILGGGFYDPTQTVLTSNSHTTGNSQRSVHIGFRLVRSAR